MGQYKTVHSPCDCLQHSRRGHFSSSEQEDSQHCHGLVIVPPCRRLPLLLPCRVLLKSSANGSFLPSIEKEEVTNPAFDWKLHISASQKRFVENQFALILFYNLTWVLDYAFVFLPRLHWCIDHTCTKVYISLSFFTFYQNSTFNIYLALVRFATNHRASLPDHFTQSVGVTSSDAAKYNALENVSLYRMIENLHSFSAHPRISASFPLIPSLYRGLQTSDRSPCAHVHHNLLAILEVGYPDMSSEWKTC